MNHQIDIINLILAAASIIIGGLLYLLQRKRPNEVRGLTYKQFVWCCIILVVGGTLWALMQLVF